MKIIDYDRKQNKVIAEQSNKIFEITCGIIKSIKIFIIVYTFIIGIFIGTIIGLSIGWYIWKADKNISSGIQNEIEEIIIEDSYNKKPKFHGPVKPIYFIKIFEWGGGEKIDKDKLSETIYSIMRKLNIKEDKNFHDLIIETCAVETDFGYIVRQKKGPALSIYQILPSTFKHTLELIKKQDKKLYKKIMQLYDHRYGDNYNFVYNLPFTTAICMMYYINIVKDLENNIKTRKDRAKVWKKYYNTEGGKGTVDIYLKRTNNHI